MADMPFQEAIDFLAGKVNLPARRWDDLKHGAHVRAFSVAGVTRDDMLSDFRAAIEKARAEGTGLNEFRKDFDAIVERTGWKYFSHGKEEPDRRAWRSRIIYTVNMRTSYMAGRYAQLTDPDVLKYRPYWQYVHSGALHPRKLHLSWNGRILLATDPAWKVMFPPNGFGCGCDVEALSKRELKALGKSEPDEAPDLRPYEDTDPRTGQPETRYPGIDRGWEYNVGEEWLGGLVPSELRKPLPAFGTSPEPLNLPPMRPATVAGADRLLDRDLPAQTYVDHFLGEFGLSSERNGYFRDRSGGIIALSQRMFQERTAEGDVVGLKSAKFDRGRYVLLMADTIRDPDEIWVDWAQVASGAALRRAYLKTFVLPDKRAIFLRFEWTRHGWVAVTGFDTSYKYVSNYRKGALIYVRK